MTFKQLNLIEPILEAVEKQGYTEPTPIQQKAIPPALEGRDLLGCAQTGTGKTAAFALPILQRLSCKNGDNTAIKALILTPTRELALQIFDSFSDYGEKLPLKCCVIFGGVSQLPQVEKLKSGADILVATPGRLLDLMNQKLLSLNGVEEFVLDEADRMLDMGFINDVKKVLSFLPKERRTMLFSATMPDEIADLAHSMLNDPVKIEVAPPATTAELIKQSVYLTDKAKKRELLTWILRNNSIYSALVFTRTKHGADRVARALNGAKISAMAIHGDKSQSARQFALSNFKSGRVQVLVATDIAARGIDIDGLSHVINFDLPNEPESYVHRIGRTGRAGADGVAISFCDYDELAYLKDIEKVIRKKITVETENPFPMEVFEHTVKPPRPPKKEKSNKKANEVKADKKSVSEPKDKASGEKTVKSNRNPNENGGKKHFHEEKKRYSGEKKPFSNSRKVGERRKFDNGGKNHFKKDNQR